MQYLPDIYLTKGAAEKEAKKLNDVYLRVKFTVVKKVEYRIKQSKK